MSLKRLTNFQKFDAVKFFKDKGFLFTKAEEWQEGKDVEHMHTVGTKITGVIYADSTDYGQDLKGVNEGESITFKVRKPVSAFNDWQPFGTQFRVEKFEKVSIWGDFRNQLSARVPELTVIQKG